MARIHGKKTTWRAAKNMVNAKELVKHFEKLGLEVPTKWNVGIDEAINLL